MSYPSYFNNNNNNNIPGYYNPPTQTQIPTPSRYNNNGYFQSQTLTPPPSPPTLPYQEPVQNTSGIQGRFIQKAEDIVPGEILMNGETSIFPLIDGSGILTKTWSNDGIIRTGLYVPYVPPTQEEETEEKKTSEDLMAVILERLDKIEKMIVKNNNNNYKYNNNKKSYKPKEGVNNKNE